jgi:hypothetical protein
MAYDFKKESLYKTKLSPEIIQVPKIKYVAVRGVGDPNDLDGDYAKAVSLQYAISYTIRMSYKNNISIDGYFEYVVPPLEGFWWMSDGSVGVDKYSKSGFSWISLIRLPDFVTEEVFNWAKVEVEKKKKIDTNNALMLEFEEGICVQCLHIGSYDDEMRTVNLMDEFLEKNGYANDINDVRHHHEIYLSDPRKVSKDKLKTIIRHPIRRI